MADTNFKQLAQAPITSAVGTSDTVFIEAGDSVRRTPLLLFAAMIKGGDISIPDETVRQAAIAYANTTFRTIEEDYPE